MPDLSVVIAAVDDRADALETLRAVCGQDPGDSLDVLLVANAGHPGIVDARQMAGVRVVVSDEPRLVPELWGLGVAASRGAVVAITMTGCVPAPDWVAAIRRLHRQPAAAVGGAIEQRTPAAVGDWAVYFARYAAYARPFAEHDVSDVPGDNGSYKREAIAADLDDIARRGFWETEINARLKARGQRMVMAPDMCVWHTRSYRIRAFSAQRWRHGRLHGRTRAAGAAFAARLLRAAAAPLAWGSMMLRAARRGSRIPNRRRELVTALPLVGWFYACWVAGEAVGLMGSPE